MVPPFAPLHDQFHGPEPVTAVAEPDAHNPVVGATVKIPLLELPHVPFTGGVAATVVDTNAPDTPPTVSVVVTAVLFAAELVCRTQTL